MQLLRTHFLGKELRLEASMSGWQALYWDNQLVSERLATAEDDPHYQHHFELHAQDSVFACRLALELYWQPFQLTYQLWLNDTQVEQHQLNQDDIARQEVVNRPTEKNRFSIIGMGSLALKLFKSAKAIKVLFAAGSLAAYSWLFSLEFALALILCLVFHEYGHIRAMKYFGLKTKGIYLIPFVGGLALSESKINTRWQDVVISIMGPFFGLILSIISLVVYWITKIELFAGLAAFNALLNVFNLLPVLPLDGGHVLKSITFSMNSVFGLVMCIVGAGAGIALSYYFGLTLLGFLLFIGIFEVAFEWRSRHQSQLLPLDRYGQTIAAIWYSLTLAGLCGIIWGLGQTGNAALGLPLQILGR